MADALQRLERAMASARGDLVRTGGLVQEVSASACRVGGIGPFVRLGDRMGFEQDGTAQIGEVVRIDSEGATVKTFGPRLEAGIGTRVFRLGAAQLRPDPSWKGRVIDALGRPLDGGEPLAQGPVSAPLDADPPAAFGRARVREPLVTGVRALDLFTPLCAGQRIGIFAGSGVGKSTLLAMLADADGFDSVVVALVGERGREVREFLEGPIAAARARAVIVVSTGDESPMMRRQAPKVALAVAESFRDRGESVLLIVDSVTRYAHAARDVALAAGEPAVARGYPPSVFSDLPRLLERAARAARARARSPGCSRCWSMATTTTIPSRTRSAGRSTATSSSTAPSRSRAATRRWTCWARSRASRPRSGRRSSATSCASSRR